MATVWQFGTAASFSRHHDAVVARGGDYVWIENLNELDDGLQAFPGGGALKRSGGGDIEISATERRAMRSVLPRMAVHLDGFAPDLAHEFGLMMFSRALREALQAGSDQIAYIPMDTSKSDAFIQSRQYEVGLVLPRRDVIDLERSDIEYAYPRKEAMEQIGEDLLAQMGDIPGFMGLKDLPEKAVSTVRRIVPKAGFEPDVDIFIERTLGGVCVSEAAAQRIVEAGIDDVCFTEMDFTLGKTPRVRAGEGQLADWGAL